MNSPNVDEDSELFHEISKKHLSAVGSYDSGFEQID